jgi:hypothetical protein
MSPMHATAFFHLFRSPVLLFSSGFLIKTVYVCIYVCMHTVLIRKDEEYNNIGDLRK